MVLHESMFVMMHMLDGSEWPMVVSMLTLDGVEWTHVCFDAYAE